MTELEPLGSDSEVVDRLGETAQYSINVVFIKDLDGTYLFANKAAAVTIGLKSEDLVGKTDFELFSPDVAEKLRSIDRWVMDIVLFSVNRSTTGRKVNFWSLGCNTTSISEPSRKVLPSRVWAMTQARHQPCQAAGFSSRPQMTSASARTLMLRSASMPIRPRGRRWRVSRRSPALA